MQIRPSGRKGDDQIRKLWIPVTVRVAWELMMAGVNVRPSTLADAREHVLRSLPAGLDVELAERWASLFLHEYITRIKEGTVARTLPDEDLDAPIPADWRGRLLGALDHVGDALVRLHYGDGLSLEAVCHQAAIDEMTLTAAREGVREIICAIALSDGKNVSLWGHQRLDLLITRVVNHSLQGCPGPVGLMSEEARGHVDQCPRCSRSVRLIRGGLLSPSDLFAPDHQTLFELSEGNVGVMALLLHPDGRRHRRKLVGALGDALRPVGTDVWLIDQSSMDSVVPLLCGLCELGSPPRHHLRGALVSGPGRWSRKALLGPLPVRAIEAARARPWADVGSVCTLPLALPTPPKATRWWTAAFGCGVLSLLSAFWVLEASPLIPSTPVEANFLARDSGFLVRFDLDDLAVLDVVTHQEGTLRVQFPSVGKDRGEWATGEGDFAIQVVADGVALIASPSGVEGLDAIIEAANRDEQPLLSLRERIRATLPEADVAISPLPAPLALSSQGVLPIREDIGQ